MAQLSWSNFLTNQFTKPLGPSLGVNWMWTKRNDHVPKNGCVGFCFLCMSKKGSFEFFLSLHILLFTLVFIFSSTRKNSLKIYYNNTSLPWALAFFYQSTFFASPTAKPVGPCQWIMQAFKSVLWGSRTPWSLWQFFPWCKLKWWLGWVQQPIIDFTGPWDNFMVPGVNNPLLDKHEDIHVNNA